MTCFRKFEYHEIVLQNLFFPNSRHEKETFKNLEKPQLVIQGYSKPMFRQVFLENKGASVENSVYIYMLLEFSLATMFYNLVIVRAYESWMFTSIQLVFSKTSSIIQVTSRIVGHDCVAKFVRYL